MIIPGQAFFKPCFNFLNFNGSDEVVPSSFLTCKCAIEAPALNALLVLSICSSIVIGTAGLSLFVGTDPVIATQIMHGFFVKLI